LFERNFGPAPPWLNEGWAQYYSTIEVQQDKLRVGGTLPHLSFTLEGAAFDGRAADGSYVLAVPVGRIPPPSQLLAMDRQTFYAFAKGRDPESDASLQGLATYMGAWALVHMMHDGPQLYQARYRRFMEKVRDAQVQSAWESAFAGINPADFDRDFRLYLASEKLTLFEYPRRRTALSWRLSRRTLSDAEVRILWSRLSPAEGAAGMAAEVDLQAAVAEAPESPEARYYRGLHWLHRKQLGAAERDLLEAARLAPQDPRFLLGVLMLRIAQAPQSDARVHPGDAIAQAAAPLAGLANSAMQLRVLALVYNDLGDHEQALGFARRASALSPIDSLSLDTEAQVLSSMGRNQEALELQRSAVAFLPEGVDAADIFNHLRVYEERERRVGGAP
jgi:tetratricopeptide (TPR) repeat protein